MARTENVQKIQNNNNSLIILQVAKEASRDANKFLRDAAGALGSGTSAADQIARRKHYSSKDGGRF